MTIPELIDRLASDDAMDAPLFREFVRACGVTLDPDDDRLAHLMEMILVGAWRDACAELQKVVLPGWEIAGCSRCDIDRKQLAIHRRQWSVMLAKIGYRFSADDWVKEISDLPRGTHPTSECRAHLIAILRAREAGG
jgi:hypothetical protein